MGKILGSWSGMRKYLEQEMLADCLKGRIRYNCTTYVGMDGCHMFEIFIDQKCAKQFSLETVNSYFLRSGASAASSTERPMSTAEYWSGFGETLERTPMCERTEYTDEEFCAALEQYRNQTIGGSIVSENPLVQMFAIFDRRLGKRTLRKQLCDGTIRPDWLTQFYQMRAEAENI